MLRSFLIGSVFYLSTIVSTSAFAGSGSCELTSGLEFQKAKRVNWIIRKDYGPQPEVPLATWDEGDRYSPLFEATISGVEISLQKNFGGINVSQATRNNSGGSYGGNVYPLSDGRLLVWKGSVKTDGQIEIFQIWCDVIK